MERVTLSEKILLSLTFILLSVSSILIGILAGVTFSDGNEILGYIPLGSHKKGVTVVFGNHFNFALMSGLVTLYGLFAISGVLFMAGHVLMKTYNKKLNEIEKREIVKWIIVMIGFLSLVWLAYYMFQGMWFQ
jgi:hypothetical protein